MKPKRQRGARLQFYLLLLWCVRQFDRAVDCFASSNGKRGGRREKGDERQGGT